jgi:hypothetical protein
LTKLLVEMNSLSRGTRFNKTKKSKRTVEGAKKTKTKARLITRRTDKLDYKDYHHISDPISDVISGNPYLKGEQGSARISEDL